MTAHAWANGFGVWHVRVSRNAAGPLIAARRALRDELLARDANVARAVWMYPERVEDLDDAETVVYREGTFRACAGCGRDIIRDAAGRWIDPRATGDDSIWRETCDASETFTAEHIPTTERETAT